MALVGVLEEAEFYNIASLVRLVKERIRDNENRTSQVHSRLLFLFVVYCCYECINIMGIITMRSI